MPVSDLDVGSFWVGPLRQGTLEENYFSAVEASHRDPSRNQGCNDGRRRLGGHLSSNVYRRQNLSESI